MLEVEVGDCILFEARIWHKSTELPTHQSEESLRLAIGIQWLAPGGLDGVMPGAYPRWPTSDIPDIVDVDDLRKRGVFGIDTAGYFLKRALIYVHNAVMAQKEDDAAKSIAGAIPIPLNSTAVSTAELATELVAHIDNQESTNAHVLQVLGCDAQQVRKALNRYVLFRRASKLHFGETQSSVFGPLRDHFIRNIMHLIV